MGSRLRTAVGGLVIILGFAGALAWALPAEAGIQTHFDTDLEGWRVTGDNAAAWNANGHPGGCLYVNDLAVIEPRQVCAWFSRLST